MMCSYKRNILVHCGENSSYNWKFKYERSKTWIVNHNLWWPICADIEVWAICLIYRNMAAFRWKMTFRVALTVLFPGVTIQNMTELSLIQSYRRLEMRTRFIVVPGERRRTGGSRAWLGRCLAENLQESLIIEEFDTREMDWLIRRMHIIHLRVRRRWQS